MKKFLDNVQAGTVDKMAKVLEKGLDPNFHDPDSGGEFVLPLWKYPFEEVYGFILKDCFLIDMNFCKGEF